ncbi:MAG: hypothetical protein J2P27_05615 [Actinobacteria bacterium]|nr:hypothetical protein [Actinomycetota bacterium]
MATRQARPGWVVRLSITRRGGWRAWAQTSGDFERRLAALASKTVSNPHIDAESRRGREYVRVTVAVTVKATDVAEALASAWHTFRQAAHDDVHGWDMASAAAEVRPAESKPPRKSVRQ